MSKKNQKPETATPTSTSAPTPDTSAGTAAPFDAQDASLITGPFAAAPSTDEASEATHRLSLEYVRSLEELVKTTEDRAATNLAEARARIVELERRAKNAGTVDASAFASLVQMACLIRMSETETLEASIGALKERVGPVGVALREAARRLRATTFHESDVVADAIRVLVDHHDPQDSQDPMAGYAA